jgi:hypothetical protein
MTLQELDHIPNRLLDSESSELHEHLAGPTLIHLPGRAPEPLFITALAHGNEDTGWVAARDLLRQHDGRALPRALSLFIGNVAAASRNKRLLDGQLDLNRVWIDTPENRDTPERAVARRVEEIMKAKLAFAAIDIHNNTGHNPHYACVGKAEWSHLRLAALFSRRTLLFHMPKGVQTLTFMDHCPSTTIECGLPGQPFGAEHALDFLNACLRLREIPNRPLPPEDLDLYRSVAIAKVPDDVTFSLGFDATKHLSFVRNLDELNFSELPAGTKLADVNDHTKARLEITDEEGRDVTKRFVRVSATEIVTAKQVIPAMLTCKPEIIRQDCLGYLMEPVSLDDPELDS